ncbi:hypothetical protein JTB14_022916 [Gonioctena quinquepunctata]|nr:hypothetical protein JTB14_022916 [Gonioctena quinquepunctata]
MCYDEADDDDSNDRDAPSLKSHGYDPNGNFLGFHPVDVETSSKTYRTMQDILFDKIKDFEKAENCFPKIGEYFEGFSSSEAENSQLCYQKVKKICDLIRYKIYKKISLSINKNINRRKMRVISRTPSKSVLQDNPIHNTEVDHLKGEKTIWIEKSKYFGELTNNNSIFTPHREHIVAKIEQNCYQDDDIQILPKKEIKIEIFPFLVSEEIAGEDEKKGLMNCEAEYFRILHDTTKSIHILEFNKKFSPWPSWIPPRSPHNLIEERLYHDPWALLAATIFLNRTSCMVARPFVFWFLSENPDPLSVLDRFPKDFEKYFVELGLQRTRAVQVYRMSYDFLFKNWTNASELYGIGNYGDCAFRMFCLGDFTVEPRDRFLKIYKAWYEKLHLKNQCG